MDDLTVLLPADYLIQNVLFSKEKFLNYVSRMCLFKNYFQILLIQRRFPNHKLAFGICNPEGKFVLWID